MQPTSVSISFLEGNINEVQGASGIRISKDWVLSHGILLRSKILRDKNLEKSINTLKPGELTSLLTNDQNDLRVNVQYRITKTDNQTTINLNKNEGIIVGCWYCPLIGDTFKNLFFTWNFSADSRKTDELLLPIFLIVRVHNDVVSYENSLESVLVILSQLIKTEICLPSPGRGARVELESTPFGNPVFIDSISQGIVSNVLGTNGCVMLTDANAVPGCEGGPVYIHLLFKCV